MIRKALTLFSLFIILHCNIFAQTITIAAAADLRFVMDEMIGVFKKTNPDIKIEVIYGSSGNLYQQIVSKAPFDIFFSADISYPKKLDSLNLTGSKPKLYAIGHLVLWSAKLDISKGIELLKKQEVKKIAIANPRVAPYGKRAMECLKYYNLDEFVKDKIVEGENVSQAAQFVLSGNAEIGMIALSLALSPEMNTKGRYFVLDEKSYSKLEQAYVIIKQPKLNKRVVSFIQFIESLEARRLFGKYGFKFPTRK
jgi:molybdate transport system substrate-binding protein